MKLESCYIENFGKLSQFHYEFNKGLNVIEAENGWGKTTFAAFLKAMLFGMEYRLGKRNITDRMRYLPWQGGKYGGNVIVEIGEKRYRIERYFGKKESEDTFAIYDLATNLETKDYTANFGEEVWKVDRDSYEKSAFISLNDIGLLNDIISGKLGDIKEQEADMEKSSKAIEALAAEMRNFKSVKKSSGIIYRKKTENLDLEIERKKCKKSIEFISQNDKWLQLEKDKIKKLDQDLRDIDDAQAMLVVYQKKKHFLEMTRQLKELKEDYDEENSFFKNQELTLQELEELEKEIKQYEEWKIKEDIPEPVHKEETEKIERLSEKYKYVISDEGQIDHYIKGYRVYLNLEDKVKNLQEELSRIGSDKAIETKKPEGLWVRILMYVFGGAMIGAGAYFFFGNLKVLGCLGVILGAVLVLWELISTIKNNSKCKNIANDYQAEENKKLEAIKEIESKKEKIQSSCINFLQKLEVEEPSDIMQELLNLKVEYAMYRQLKINLALAKDNYKHSSQETQKLMEESKGNIEKILNRYYKTVPAEYSEAVDIMKQKRIICKEKYKQYGTLLKTYRRFCEENDLERIKKAVLPIETEEVLLARYRNRRSEIAIEKSEIDKKIARYMHDINLAQLDVDKLVEIESKLEQNHKEIQEMEENYYLLSIAKQSMEKAKENLAEKYMEDMTTAFQKYLGILGTIDAKAYCMDTQLNIQVEQNGSRYTGKSLSRGKQDLVQVCMRMALVEAIYKDVMPPVLILDDPFVNLDDMSILYGLEMLRNVSNEYQMIYFVCHSSRKIGKKIKWKK